MAGHESSSSTTSSSSQSSIIRPRPQRLSRREVQLMEENKYRAYARVRAAQLSKRMYYNETSTTDEVLLDQSDSYPHFSRREVQLGRILGEGGFGIVYEVARFQLQDDDSNNNAKESSSSSPSSPKSDGRLFLAEHCIRHDQNRNARYAIKKLSPKTVKRRDRFVQGMIDMKNETRILSAVPPHPNLIKMRAVANDVSPFHEDFFFVLDRLYGTLCDKMDGWKFQSRRHQSTIPVAIFPPRIRAIKIQQQQQLFKEQLLACYDLSSAVAHLHKHNVIHRDLKPHNIGFNVRGDLTLFDLGLGRDLPCMDRADKDGLFKMTGHIGSPRYMAPEVATSRKYNETCDVYSYGIVIWEVLTLHKSYEKFGMSFLGEQVWEGMHARPDDVDKSATLPSIHPHSTRLIDLIHQAWSRNVQERPSMEQIKRVLHGECLEILSITCTKEGQIHVRQKKNIAKRNSGGDLNDTLDVKHFSNRRRSTFVFDASQQIK
jgi:serine/threonine protein kinase